MQVSGVRDVVRFVPLLLLGVLPLLAGSCGTSSGGSGEGSRSGSQGGGIVRPHATAYELTPTSDPAFAIGGCDVVAKSLPRRVDLRHDGIIPRVQNQRWNSCVGWTLGYYLMTGVYARRHLTFGDFDEALAAIDITDPERWFSPDFIYSQRDDLAARERIAPGEPICFDLDGKLGCMRPENALRVLIERGCCKWPWMCTQTETSEFRSCTPDDFNYESLESRREWPGASPSAESFRPRCYIRFGSLDDRTNFPLDDMKAWLHERGTPLAVVVQMTEGWVSYRGQNRSTVVVEEAFPANVVEERSVCLEAEGADLGGQHMMTIIGYDDTFPSAKSYPGLPAAKHGSFLVINQWGEKWGDKGYMWIPYAELRKIWIGGYGLDSRSGADDLEQDDGSHVCVQDDQGGWENLFEPDDVPRNLDRSNPLDPNPPVITTAKPLLADTPQGSSVGEFDTADWFVFEVTERNTFVEVTLVPDLFTGDLDLKLTDFNQRRIGGSTNRGSPLSEELTRLICEPGTYFVKVYPFAGIDQGPYEISLTMLPEALSAGAIELNDDICGAEEISIDGGTILSSKLAGEATGSTALWAGRLDAADRCDWCTLVAPKTATLGISLEFARVGGVDEEREVEPDATLEVWRGDRPDSATFLGRASRLYEGPAILGPVPAFADALSQLRVPVIAGERLYLRVHTASGAVQFPTVTIFEEEDHGYAQTPAGARPLVFSRAPVQAGDIKTRWQAIVESEIRLEDGPYALAYHRLLAPPGATVTVRLESLADGPGLFATLLGEVRGSTPLGVGLGGEEFAVEVPSDGVYHPFVVAVAADLTQAVLDRAPYRLRVAFTFDEVTGLDEIGDDNLPVLRLGERHVGVLGPLDPHDWYRVELGGIGQGGIQGAFLLTLGGSDTGLVLDVRRELPGGATEPVGIGAEAGRTSTSVSRHLNVPAGATQALWVQVLSLRALDAATGYSLRIAQVAAVNGPGVGLGDDNPTSPQPLVLPGETRGDIGAGDTRDYFRGRLNLDGGRTATIRLSIPNDPFRLWNVRLWDGAGRELNSEKFNLPGQQPLLEKVKGGSSITVLVTPHPFADKKVPTPYAFSLEVIPDDD